MGEVLLTKASLGLRWIFRSNFYLTVKIKAIYNYLFLVFKLGSLTTMI